MQNFITTANKKTVYSNERNLISILTAESLLITPRYQKIISDIQKLLCLEADEFDILYRQLIDNFVQLVQLLPSSYGDKLGTIMNNGLWRALLSLQLLALDDSSCEIKEQLFIDRENPLLKYMLFSAALLYEVGAVTNGISVIVSQADGSLIKEWLPYQGAMYPTTINYYRIRPNSSASNWFNSSATLLLARQLMPAAGFNWLAEDQNIFSSWITLLSRHKEKEQSYLNLYFEQVNQKLQAIVSLKQPSLPTNLTIITAEGTALADEFLEWLRSDNSIWNNDHPLVHFLGNTILLELSTIVARFCQQSLQQPKPSAVIGELAKIGFINLNEPLNYRYDPKLKCPLAISQIVVAEAKEDNSDQLTTVEQLSSSKESNNHDGFEITRNCFLSMFSQLKIPYQKNYNSDELDKENKKTLKRIKLRKMRRFKILLKEVEEALKLQQQLNLGKK